MAERVLVIGLDGGTWTVLRPYMAAGLLPTLSKLWDRSYRATLRTTLPAVTPVAWTSLATGVNPGKHRIFGFGTFRGVADEYVSQPTHRRNIARPTLWRILSDHHCPSRIVNVPMTYPPEPIEGSIVTGMFTPGPDSPYTWPPELKDELAAAGLRPKFATDLVRRMDAGQDIGLSKALAGDANAFLDDVDDMTRRQHQIARYLIGKDWRLFMKVYLATDLIQHFLWDDLLPPAGETGSPRARRIARSLRLVDDCVGELIDLAGPDTTIMLVSDHGFGRCGGQFALGQWLAERGYAAYRRRSLGALARRAVRALGLNVPVRRILGGSRADRMSGRTLPLLWTKTKAFVDDGTAGVALRINTRGAFREGIVEPGQPYERFRDELIEALEALRIDGVDGAPIPRALKREDVYHGPYVGEAPDILLVPNADALIVFVNGQPGEPLLRLVPERVGEHLLEGICLIAGRGVRADRELHHADITDVLPTVLALLGVPVPEDVDGRVLAGAFAQPPKATIQATPSQVDPDADEPVFSEAERRAIEQRLRNLGYLE